LVVTKTEILHTNGYIIHLHVSVVRMTSAHT
jgi:hypothetical protein